MNYLPITFILMPMAMLLGIIVIVVSIKVRDRANKYIVRELIATGIVIILLAIGTMLVHLFLTMFTPIQAAALFMMVVIVPTMVAGLRSLFHFKRQ